MSGVNKVILVGHLGKDPEVKALDSSVKVARFSIATTESYNDRNTGQRVDQTEWHNIVLWKGLAEIAEKYLKKGSQIYLEGKLKTSSYDKNGEKMYYTEVIGQSMQMIGGKPEAQQSNSAPQSNDETDDLPF